MTPWKAVSSFTRQTGHPRPSPQPRVGTAWELSYAGVVRHGVMRAGDWACASPPHGCGCPSNRGDRPHCFVCMRLRPGHQASRTPADALRKASSDGNATASAGLTATAPPPPPPVSSSSRRRGRARRLKVASGSGSGSSDHSGSNALGDSSASIGSGNAAGDTSMHLAVTGVNAAHSSAVTSLLATRSVFPAAAATAAAAASTATAAALAGALVGPKAATHTNVAASTHDDSTKDTDDGVSGDAAVAEACEALGAAGITPSVLMLTVAHLLPDAALKKQLTAAASRNTTTSLATLPAFSLTSQPTGATPAPQQQATPPRRSPDQHLAHCRAEVTKIGKARADAVTLAAEAAKRRRAKRTAAAASFNATIDAVRQQLELDLAQLAAYEQHEDSVDAAHAATDAACVAKFDQQLTEANAAVAVADAAAIAAGEARALRPSAAPVDVDEVTSEIEELLSDIGSDTDDACMADESLGVPCVEYVAPPACITRFTPEEMAALATSRGILCHWFAQPSGIPLTFGQLGLPVATVRMLVGDVAWARDYDTDATPLPEDTIPRPVGGVLLDALGRLQFDASASWAPSGHALAAIKAAASRAAPARKSGNIAKTTLKRACIKK